MSIDFSAALESQTIFYSMRVFAIPPEIPPPPPVHHKGGSVYYLKAYGQSVATETHRYVRRGQAEHVRQHAIREGVPEIIKNICREGGGPSQCRVYKHSVLPQKILPEVDDLIYSATLNGHD